MLRRVLLAIGILLLLTGLALLLLGRQPEGLAPAGLGGLLLLVMLVEHHTYQRIEDAPPGPDWQLTGERFRELGSGARVVVYYNPASGQRRYIRVR